MDFIIDYLATRKLAHLLKNIPNNVENVYAAVAYSEDHLLLNQCIEKGIRLEWWGLFNSGISTSIDLIKKAISSGLISFYPFAEYFHPKIIYLKNYGIYIGSANMTYNALYYNVEAGVFIYENEITQKMHGEIDTFFDYLRKNSVMVTQEELENLDKYQESIIFDKKKLSEANQNINSNFEDLFSHLFLLKPGIQNWETTKTDRINKRRLVFLQEWRETQNFLQIIHKRIAEIGKQPKWISEEADITIITDQLLHAYYYTYILKGDEEGKNSELINKYYDLHKRNPSYAIDEAISWWETLEEAPIFEDVHINNWGPKNKKLISKLVKQDLNYDEFHTLMSQNHAALTHARQIPNAFFKLPKDFITDVDGRIKIFSEWLFKQKSKKGLNINEVIRYLVTDNNISLEEKIFSVLTDEKYRIERFGKSIIGELVGWGRPDITHIRNNRVNKSLRCLGFDVQLFSE